MHVIWSFGQVYPDYSHSPGSGIEAGTASDNMFYLPDELKYHGSVNRGTATINFFGEHMHTRAQPSRHTYIDVFLYICKGSCPSFALSEESLVHRVRHVSKSDWQWKAIHS